MKMIKKLITPIILLALCICCIVPFAGCDSGWVEVQGIICNLDDGSKIVAYSSCTWDITTEEITKEEYDNTPNELRKTPPSSSQVIPINRTEFIENANNLVGNTYYYARYTYHNIVYEKYTCKNYEIQYLKIKISGKTIEIDNNDNIEKYSFVSNEIIYFND